jgi:hypothetical protein
MDAVHLQEEPRLLFGRGYYVEFNQFAHLLITVTKEDFKEGLNSSSLADLLGIATAKAEGIIYLARGFDLLKRRKAICATELGKLIAKYDPFFDDIGTLWFLHYIVSSEPRQLVWNRFANSIVPQMRSFTLQQFRAAFTDQEENHSAYSANRHVAKETLTVIDAYINKNFARLAYLRAEDDIYYTLDYCETVPLLVLGASIVRYRDRHRPGETAISVVDLLTTPNSPGVIFQLSEANFRRALEQLKLQPGFSLESQADLDQVRLTDNTPAYAWMERYYVSK